MYSPGLGSIKGKGKMSDGDVKVTMRGKVTDAKRVIEYIQHQNSQHDQAIGHLQHTAKQLESLR
jgi:mediator of RNA polymerase II transcription subunit 14